MSAGPAQGREVTPRERLRGFWRTIGKRRGLVTKVTALMLGAIMFGTFLMTPEWKAESSLFMRLEQVPQDQGTSDQNAAATTRVGAVSPLAVLNSYVEALQSRTTAEQVVREFALDKRPESHALRDRIKDKTVSVCTRAIGSVSRKMAGGIEGTQDDKFRKTVDDLQDSVAAEVDQDTELVLLTVLYPDRHLAQQINQRMIDILQQRTVQMGQKDAQAAYQSVMAALPAASKRLAEADTALAQFKRRNGIVTLSEEQRVRIQRMDVIESDYNQAKSALGETEARLEVARKDLESRKQPITLSTTVVESPTIHDIKNDLFAKEEVLAGLRQTYTDEHPEVVRLKSQIEAAQVRLRQEVERVLGTETKGLAPEYAGLVQSLVTLESDRMGQAAKERALSGMMGRYRASLRDLPVKERQLEELEREQRIASDLYLDMSRRAEALRNASQNTAPPVSIAVIDPPRLPKGLSDIGSPPYLVIVVLGPILALLIGLAAAFVAEYFDDTMSTEEEIAALLGLPMVGAIPHLRQRALPSASTDPSLEQQHG